MATAPLACTKCKAPLPADFQGLNTFAPCPACEAPLRLELFPALFRGVEAGQAGELVGEQGESSCFYHPQKKAVIPCDGCGRFLCSLCEVEFLGQHLCPSCLETGRTKGKLKNLQNQRILYDSIALALATLPLLIFYFTIFTAPIALYLVIRHWNSPTSLIPRSKVRLVVAGLFATLQIVAWIIAFYFIFTR